MKNMKYLWILSMLGFLGVLLATYVQLPDPVEISTLDNGRPDYYVEREPYFYIAFGVMLFLNVCLLVGGNLFIHVSPSFPFPMKKFWLQNKDTQKVLKGIFKGWFRGIAFCLNLFMMVILTIIFNYNDPDFNFEYLDFFLAPAGILTVIWLMTLFVALNRYKATAHRLNINVS